MKSSCSFTKFSAIFRADRTLIKMGRLQNEVFKEVTFENINLQNMFDVQIEIYLGEYGKKRSLAFNIFRFRSS